MQDGVGRTGADTDGQGKGRIDGVVSLGGLGVGMQRGRLGSDGTVNAGGAAPGCCVALVPLLQSGFGWALTWSQAGLTT